MVVVVVLQTRVGGPSGSGEAPGKEGNEFGCTCQQKDC